MTSSCPGTCYNINNSSKNPFETEIPPNYDDVITWKRFSLYWPLVMGIYRSLCIPLTKTSSAELWCFLCCTPEQIVEQTVEWPVIPDAACRSCDITVMYSLFIIFVFVGESLWNFAHRVILPCSMWKVRKDISSTKMEVTGDCTGTYK